MWEKESKWMKENNLMNEWWDNGEILIKSLILVPFTTPFPSLILLSLLSFLIK